MRLRGVRERHRRVDDRADVPGDHRRPQLFADVGDDLRLLRRRSGAQGRRGDRLASLHERAEVEFGGRAALHADDDEAAVGGECGDVALEVFGSDDVEDDIGAGRPVRVGADLVDAGDEVLLAVVDDGVGAEFAAELGLLRGADGDDDLHPEEVRDLDRGGADSRSAAVDEQPFADADATAADDVRVDGCEHLGQGSGGGEVEGVGHREELTGGRGDLLGVAAAGEQRGDAIADAPVLHVGAELDDRARDLEAGDLRRTRRRVVEALPLQEVGAIHSGGVDSDEDLVRPDLRGGDVGELQCLGISGGGNRDSAHVTTVDRGAVAGRSARR